jgi:hypothetical protein
MQARPSLQQRVMGFWGLLSEQFGTHSQHGTLINVRITHGQLAAAVGATRTSITRVLSELRALGRVSTVNKDGGRLFVWTNSPSITLIIENNSTSACDHRLWSVISGHMYHLIHIIGGKLY